MKRIRIGKDIRIRWEITTDGASIPLEGRDLLVEIKSPVRVVRNIPFSVDGNTIIMTYYGTEQKWVGEYSVTLWENKGKQGQNVVDAVSAFTLVRTSPEEADFIGGDLQVESIDLGTSNLEILSGGSSTTPDNPDIANINATLREHTESIRTINTSIESHADSIRELNATTTKQGNQVEALTAKIEENAANISGAAADASEALIAAQVAQADASSASENSTQAHELATAAKTASEQAQGTAASALSEATEAAGKADAAERAATEAKEAAESAKQTAENEANARAEADTKLQSQINGKQDNIGSFSADEKNAFLVSLGLGKIGVISQKQNWKSNYSSYTVSDVVKGIIPQYIIDHWISLSSEGKKRDGTVYFRFNEETGYFECNDLVDITLNDAINIMQYGQAETFNKFPNECKKVRVVFCANLSARFANTGYLGVGNYTERVYCQGILSVNRCFIVTLDGYDLVQCPRLRDVLYINLEYNSRTFTLSGLKNLTTFLGIKMRGNFSFKDSPLLSNESILFLINHEAATSAITITLHPDAYARAMANADILAALETHTNVSLASA